MYGCSICQADGAYESFGDPGALKITENPEVISFAGGAPSPDLFPIQEIMQATCAILAEAGKQALQYGPTEGFNPLREKIAARMNRIFKTKFRCENILIISGSQQGLDLSGKLFLNEGDVILCEKPMYPSRHQRFSG